MDLVTLILNSLSMDVLEETDDLALEESVHLLFHFHKVAIFGRSTLGHGSLECVELIVKIDVLLFGAGLLVFSLGNGQGDCVSLGLHLHLGLGHFLGRCLHGELDSLLGFDGTLGFNVRLARLSRELQFLVRHI